MKNTPFSAFLLLIVFSALLFQKGQAASGGVPLVNACSVLSSSGQNYIEFTVPAQEGGCPDSYCISEYYFRVIFYCHKVCSQSSISTELPMSSGFDVWYIDPLDGQWRQTSNGPGAIWMIEHAGRRFEGGRPDFKYLYPGTWTGKLYIWEWKHGQDGDSFWVENNPDGSLNDRKRWEREFIISRQVVDFERAGATTLSNTFRGADGNLMDPNPLSHVAVLDHKITNYLDDDLESTTTATVDVSMEKAAVQGDMCKVSFVPKMNLQGQIKTKVKVSAIVHSLAGLRAYAYAQVAFENGNPSPISTAVGVANQGSSQTTFSFKGFTAPLAGDSQAESIEPFSLPFSFSDETNEVGHSMISPGLRATMTAAVHIRYDSYIGSGSVAESHALAEVKGAAPFFEITPFIEP